MLCKGYTPEDTSYIWSQWEPLIQLPPSHPFAEGALARGHILIMLQAAYTTPELAAKDTQSLNDLAAVAIPVETFILLTTVTLREKEMVVYNPSHLHSIPCCWPSCTS